MDHGGNPASSLLVTGVAGTVGSLCVLLGVAQGGSPFATKAAHAWFFGIAPSAVHDANSSTRFIGIMLTYFGILLMLASWFELIRVVRRQRGTPIKRLVATLIAWSVPALVGPPLFSRDVYSYAAQGQLVTQGINPYIHGASALRGGPFLPLVDPLWRHSPAPYGPAWERLSGWIVQLSGHDVLGSIVGFRLLALFGVTLLVWAVPVLARSLGRDASPALALGVLNPWSSSICSVAPTTMPLCSDCLWPVSLSHDSTDSWPDWLCVHWLGR